MYNHDLPRRCDNQVFYSTFKGAAPAPAGYTGGDADFPAVPTVPAFLTGRRNISRNQPSTVQGLPNISIPHELRYIAEAVTESRWMLELKDDWDGEGSLSYSEDTWKRAVSYVLRGAIGFHETGRGVCNTPKIDNGPEGSIDIHWTTPNRYLLINFPSDRNELPMFYGRGEEEEEIKGTISLSKQSDWFLAWLSGGQCQTK